MLVQGLAGKGPDHIIMIGPTNPGPTGLGGAYAENNNISPVVPQPEPAELQALMNSGQTPVGVVPHAIDPSAVDGLWKLSEHPLVR